MTTRKTGLRGRPLPHRTIFADELVKGNPEAHTRQDYNLVRMSDFKSNPAKFLIETGDIPLAISRYGHIQAMLVSVRTYNQLLDRTRELRERVLELRKILDGISPDIVQRVFAEPEAWMVERLTPKWPLLHSMSRRAPVRHMSPRFTSLELAEMAREAEWAAGTYIPVREGSEDEWRTFGELKMRPGEEFEGHEVEGEE